MRNGKVDYGMFSLDLTAVRELLKENWINAYKPVLIHCSS